MKHPPPSSALEELKKELKSRSSSKSPIPAVREQVTNLLPEFVSNFSSFNGKPEYGTFLNTKRESTESESQGKKVKTIDRVMDSTSLEHLRLIPPGKWNEIGKKYKNSAQDFSAKDKSSREIKLGAIYFLSSTLSYLQGSVLRKDFISEFNSCQELLNVTFSRLNKTQLHLLLSLIYIIDSNLHQYSIDLSLKKIKSLNSKIEALEKVSSEENVTREISDLQDKIISVKENIVKFSEISIKRLKESFKNHPDFYRDSCTSEILARHGPISFTQIQDISLIGKQYSHFRNFNFDEFHQRPRL